MRSWRLKNKERLKQYQHIYDTVKRDKAKKRECDRKYVRKHRAKLKVYKEIYRDMYPNKVKEGQLQAKYGISLDEYNTMLADQHGVCAICHQPERYKSRGKSINALCVDHNHTTGKVRALLRQSCNRAIGLLHEDPARLIAAAEYLEKHDG